MRRIEGDSLREPRQRPDRGTSRAPFATNLALILLTLVGCGSNQTNSVMEDSGSEVASTADGTTDADAGACAWPASVTQIGDASTAGCWAQATFNICEVPSGGTVNGQDGTITGADGKPVTNACHNACSASEYALTCAAEVQSHPIPSPDGSLGCKAIPVPTPSNQLFYCCPCAGGQ
jgi:hypothetical protein